MKDPFEVIKERLGILEESLPQKNIESKQQLNVEYLIGVLETLLAYLKQHSNKQDCS